MRISARIVTAIAAYALAGQAAAIEPLDDNALARVSGADGVGFAAHIAINDPALGGTAVGSLSFGFAVDGNTNHVVIRNLHGTIDISPLNLSAHARPDSGDYLALGLPASVRFGNFGFDSISVQSDPTAAVTESLGRINLDGTIGLRGELRLWAK